MERTRLTEKQKELYYSAMRKGKLCATMREGEKFPFADTYEVLFKIDDMIYVAYDNPMTTKGLI
jgi:hypothetical protein